MKLLLLVLVAASLAQAQPTGASSLGVSVPSSTTIITNPDVGGDIVSGCVVEYTGTGLVFQVSACEYTIAGVSYEITTTTQVTLAAADGSNPRIDIIGVNNGEVVFVEQGTAAASPSAPSIDAATELELTFVYIAAAATTPGNITSTFLFKDNTSEWTYSDSGSTLAVGTNNPFRGTSDIEATSAVLNDQFTLTKPAAGTENLSSYAYLFFYIRSKGTWPTANGGSNAARFISLFWRNAAGTQVGNQVVLRDGVFGFSSNITTQYQLVGIPIALFGTGSNLVASLRGQISGNSGSSSIGFYIDEVSIQNTVAVPGASSENPLLRTIGASFGQMAAGATAISEDLTACVLVRFAGTILDMEIAGNVSGNAVVDVKTVAKASWSGVGSTTSITAAAIPALTADVRVADSLLTGWTKAFAADTQFCFVLTGASTVGGVTISLKALASN